MNLPNDWLKKPGWMERNIEGSAEDARHGVSFSLAMVSAVVCAVGLVGLALYALRLVLL